jgi:hypothetical protein
VGEEKMIPPVETAQFCDTGIDCAGSRWAVKDPHPMRKTRHQGGIPDAGSDGQVMNFFYPFFTELQLR